MDDLPYELMEVKAQCLCSLIYFTKTFFKLRTGREFKLSQPIGRESHHIMTCRELHKVFNQEICNLNINFSPRYSKTEILIHFVAWAIANYPDSNFIYASYSHFLATKATQTIREIISLPHFRKLFGVSLSDSSSAKDNFTTNYGGTVFAAGTGGTITGFGAGIRGVTNRFGGAFILDDSLKPDEATSDTIRQGVIDWWFNTAQSRLNNGNRTPVIHIGQRVHEADLPALFISMPDWNHLIIPALDPAGNALDPEMHTREALIRMREQEPYVFAAQHQQDPQPAGGGIFKGEDFPILAQEPNILSTFISVDSAETNKTWNDATVFAFWGLYKIIQSYCETDVYALHCIHCVELWCEPKDLENEFLQFYAGCMRHTVKPGFAAIEKKSTGTTLVSVLKNVQGIRVIPIDRTVKSGSKTTRFLEIQPYIARKLVSLPFGARHTDMFVNHMKKITTNDSHARDDLCDATEIAIRIALIDKTIINLSGSIDKGKKQETAKMLMGQFNRLQSIRGNQVKRF